MMACNLATITDIITLFTWTLVFLCRGRETINFDINPPDPAEPFPTELAVAVSLASVTIIGTNLIMLFKKRERKKSA